MQILLEKQREFNIETHVSFLDLKRGFDRVNRMKLLKIPSNVTRGFLEKRFPIFYLECKQVTVSNTWVTYGHTRSLSFDAVAISVEAVITAVDKAVEALVVTCCVLLVGIRAQ
jgi:hypothetical protein